MDDLISRQAALDDAHRQIWYRMNQQGMKDRIDEWLNNLPSAEPTVSKMEQVEDCISRRDVLDLVRASEPQLLDSDALYMAIEDLPSAQPERSNKEFIKLTVRNSNGRPYYSIIYLEIDKNGVGHDFEGYSSYDLDVISDFLRKDFGIGQPERKTGKWMRQEADCVWADICSECGEAYIGENYSMSSKPPVNFCPNCGADMRGEKDGSNN